MECTYCKAKFLTHLLVYFYRGLLYVKCKNCEAMLEIDISGEIISKISQEIESKAVRLDSGTGGGGG